MLDESAINSETWRQNFRPHVNGQRVSWAVLELNLMTGNTCELELEYEDSWMIGAPGKPGAKLRLDYKLNAEGHGLEFNPPLGELVEMAEGSRSLIWTITAVEAPSGAFMLEFSIPEFPELLKSEPVPVTYFNLQQDLDVRFDVFPAFFAESIHPCHGAMHTIAIKPRPDTKLLNRKINILLSESSLGVKLTPASEQILTEEGLQWDLDCRNTSINGILDLKLLLVDTQATSLPMIVNLAHNLVTAKRWDTGPHYAWPDESYYRFFIYAESVFLKLPAPKVPVSVSGNPPDRVTDYKGELSIKGPQSAFGTFTIVNMYDGTRV